MSSWTSSPDEKRKVRVMNTAYTRAWRSRLVQPRNKLIKQHHKLHEGNHYVWLAVEMSTSCDSHFRKWENPRYLIAHAYWINVLCACSILFRWAPMTWIFLLSTVEKIWIAFVSSRVSFRWLHFVFWRARHGLENGANVPNVTQFFCHDYYWRRHVLTRSWKIRRKTLGGDTSIPPPL